MSKPLEGFVYTLHAFSLAQVCSMSLGDLLRWGFPSSLSFQVLIMVLRRGVMKLTCNLWLTFTKWDRALHLLTIKIFLRETWDSWKALALTNSFVATRFLQIARLIAIFRQPTSQSGASMEKQSLDTRFVSLFIVRGILPTESKCELSV